MSQRLLKFNMCGIVLSVLATPTFPFPLKKKKKKLVSFHFPILVKGTIIHPPGYVRPLDIILDISSL